MSRQAWNDFICSPERAGRHLSAIGRGVAGAQSEAIDLTVLQAFLERLRDATDDVRLLGSAVDLITGGYAPFASEPLHRVLDALSNEMLAQEEIVGPGLRGNPRWDRTLLLRMSGNLSPVHFVSRTSHRSFNLPENQLLAWLVEDLRTTITLIEQRVGSSGLHPVLEKMRFDCEIARWHHWFGDVSIPLQPTGEMLSAANRQRRSEYRTAAKLAERRLDIETRDKHSWWYTVISLLAVNWLEPINDDDLFELYVLVLTLDVLTIELGLGEPVEYGLVTSRRGHVALFDAGNAKIRVYFDQSAASVMGLPTEYGSVIAHHAGISGAARRPDIILVAESAGEKRVVIIEMKKTADGRYISDSIYKVFGYLHDFRHMSASGYPMKAVLVVPSGISVAQGAPADRSLLLASGDDRAGVADALRTALAE